MLARQCATGATCGRAIKTVAPVAPWCAISSGCYSKSLATQTCIFSKKSPSFSSLQCITENQYFNLKPQDQWRANITKDNTIIRLPPGQPGNLVPPLPPHKRGGPSPLPNLRLQWAPQRQPLDDRFKPLQNHLLLKRRLPTTVRTWTTLSYIYLHFFLILFAW